ncbi:MAG: orotidine-5'-phosphate decarboxylase [Candidatus Njordarchaeia archaeon]
MIGEKLKERLERLSVEKKSRVIFALDKMPENLDKADLEKHEEEIINLVKKVSSHIIGVKIGIPLIMLHSVKIAERVREECAIPIIGDLKIADIGYTNGLISEIAYSNKIDAVIAHMFMGVESILPIVESAKKHDDRGIFLIPTMSHRGAGQFLNKHTEDFLEIVNELDVTGVIAPATRPSEVRHIRSKIGNEKLILTPGVGAQGGDAREAIRSGADYIIVGRAIYRSENPLKAAKMLAESSWV